MTAASVSAGYGRLVEGGAVVEGRCALIWVEGPDAPRFLQGLVSNDVLSLPPGEACYALLLDRKGRIRCDLRVLRDAPEAFTLVVDSALGETLMDTLEGYHFSEDLELTGPEPFALLTAAATAPLALGVVDIAVPGRVPGTVDLIGADGSAMIAALSLETAPPEALEVLRIEAGVPLVGREIGEATLVQEVGLESVAVSFDKGCYLGQETVARTAYRGRVNRVLRGVALSATAEPGAEARLEGKVVGRVSSSAVSPAHGPIGLAVLARVAEPGRELHVEGVEEVATVRDLPFR